jgi:hypothetical protein
VVGIMLTARDRNRSEKIKQYKDLTQYHISATQKIEELQSIIKLNLELIEYAFIQNSMRMDTCDMEQVELKELADMVEESENFKTMLDYLDSQLEFMIKKCHFSEVEVSEINI